MSASFKSANLLYLKKSLCQAARGPEPFRHSTIRRTEGEFSRGSQMNPKLIRITEITSISEFMLSNRGANFEMNTGRQGLPVIAGISQLSPSYIERIKLQQPREWFMT